MQIPCICSNVHRSKHLHTNLTPCNGHDTALLGNWNSKIYMQISFFYHGRLTSTMNLPSDTSQVEDGELELVLGVHSSSQTVVKSCLFHARRFALCGSGSGSKEESLCVGVNCSLYGPPNASSSLEGFDKGFSSGSGASWRIPLNSTSFPEEFDEGFSSGGNVGAKWHEEFDQKFAFGGSTSASWRVSSRIPFNSIGSFSDEEFDEEILLRSYLCSFTTSPNSNNCFLMSLSNSSN